MENKSKIHSPVFVKVEQASEIDFENANEINDPTTKTECVSQDFVYQNIKEEADSSFEEQFDLVENISNSLKIKKNQYAERETVPQTDEKEINVGVEVSLKVDEDVDLTFDSNDVLAKKGRRKNARSEQLHQCDICNKFFVKATTLKIHKRLHTGDKPYHCDVCNRCFAQSSTLTAHKRIHSGDKPYRCTVCDKTFSVSGDLRKHSRVHSGEKPYQCDICLKRFTVSSSLNSHKRIHSGVRPYQCDICNKSFTQSPALTIHKRTHSKDKLYQCGICYKKFTRSSTLNSHTRLIHSKDNGSVKKL